MSAEPQQSEDHRTPGRTTASHIQGYWRIRLSRFRIHRLEVELVVEVHGNDAVAALFALIIMGLWVANY